MEIKRLLQNLQENDKQKTENTKVITIVIEIVIEDITVEVVTHFNAAKVEVKVRVNQKYLVNTNPTPDNPIHFKSTTLSKIKNR